MAENTSTNAKNSMTLKKSKSATKPSPKPKEPKAPKVLSASAKAKKVYYVSPADFTAELKKYYETDVITNELALMIKNIADTHGLNYVILVPHNIIGPRQKFDDPYRNVASIMINRMLQGKQPIIYGNGEQKRCFSFMQDVTDPLMIACETDVADGRIVNIGPDEEFVTINELAQKLSTILNFKLDPIYMPGRPQEVFHANCSANLARELLNYKTTTSLESGLVELANWIKSKGAREFNYHLPLEFVTDKTPKTWTDRLM